MTISKLYKQLRSADRRFNKKIKAGHPKNRELFSVFKPVILEYLKELPSVEETVHITINGAWDSVGIHILSNDKMHNARFRISFRQKIIMSVWVSDMDIYGNEKISIFHDNFRRHIPLYDIYFSKKEIRDFAKTLTEDERAFFILNNVTLFENELLNEEAEKNEC